MVWKLFSISTKWLTDELTFDRAHCILQNAPLDMFTDDFYLKRKDELDERLHFVYTATEQVELIIGNICQKYFINSI